MLGTTVSHFQVLQKLGQGGMGEVYLAQDTRLHRKVALKFPTHDALSHPDLTKRLHLEARAAAELSHPSIAAIYDIGEHEGRPFLVLEYVEGETLEARLQRGPLPIETILHYGRLIADALAHAHGRGFIHRDLKPSNIMLTPSGDVKILDLGLARGMEATQITHTGMRLGTVTHMSPEQAQGKRADARSDLWAVGVVLYQCLVGKLPFAGEGEAVILDRIRSAEAELPTALRSGVPMELERVVRRCLEKDPAHRYQTAADLSAELRSIEHRLTQDPTGSTHTAADRGVRRPRPPRLRTLIAAGALLALALASGRLLLSRSRPARPPAGEQSTLAVADFSWSGSEAGREAAYAVTALVRTGLAQASPCRLIGEEHLHDLRDRAQRLAGVAPGSPVLPSDHALLSFARQAGASTLLTGDVEQQGQELVAKWRIVDVGRGDDLLQMTSSSIQLQELAQEIVGTSSGLLRRRCPADGAPAPRSVSELTTQSERAYQHFAMGKLLEEEGKTVDAAREYQQAVAIDSTFALAYFRLSHLGDLNWVRGEMTRWANAAWRHRDRLGVQDRLHVEAWRAFVTDNYTEAQATAREICARWPDDREALLLRCGIEFWDWNFAESLKVADAGLAVFPEDLELTGYRAASLFALGKYRAALQLQQAIVEHDRENPAAWVQLAGGYLGLGLPDSAEVSCREALRLSPNLTFARATLSDAQFARGDVRNAEETLTSIISGPGSSASDSISAQLSLGRLYFWTGRVDRSLNLFKEMHDRTTDQHIRHNTRLGRAWMLLELNSQRAALDLMRAEFPLEAAQPMGIDERELRAAALVVLDSLAAAQEQLNRLQDGNWALRARARLELTAGQAQTALDHMVEREALGIGFGMELYGHKLQKGRALRALQRYPEAAAEFGDLLRLNAGITLARYELARVYEDMGRPLDARREYERVVTEWRDADADLPQLLDARLSLRRLAQGGG